MGCGGSRETENNEYEEAICQCEERLGFSKLNSDRIDEVFKRYSLSTKMSSSQFMTACRELNLASDYGHLDHPVTKFFNSFKSGKFFSQRKLSALGVLLGKSDDKEKAKVLFKIYDDSKDGNLDIGEVRNMLDDIVEIGLIFLPTLALNSGEDEVFKQDMVKFNKKLVNIQFSIKNFFEIVIMRKDDEHGGEPAPPMEFVEGPDEGDDLKKSGKRRKNKKRVTGGISRFQIEEISFEQFVEKFEKRNMPKLCNAHKLREMALEFYSQTVAPRELVKDYILESSRSKAS